ncbi:MAG: NifU family protein [Candidatus Dormibacteria bacterium]
MEKPQIHVSPRALTRIGEVRANNNLPEAGVRIAITGREGGKFAYDLSLVPPGAEVADDLVIEGPEGIRFHIPPASAPNLEGITLVADELTGAIGVDNPNPLWKDPLAEQVQEFIDSAINPAVATHGGHIDLLDVDDGVAYVHMGGGCQGCGMASVTLTQGVRSAVLEQFSQITDVRDTTDHAQGTNPYYQASKK